MQAAFQERFRANASDRLWAGDGITTRMPGPACGPYSLAGVKNTNAGQGGPARYALRMWRVPSTSEDEAIVRMCLALYAEDPGPETVSAGNMQRTLLALREARNRGRAVVLDIEGQLCGYALLISFWSNELGGEVYVIDEVYVEPRHRGHRYATRLFEDLAAGTEPWSAEVVALALEVTPNNVRARRLYERLGFRAHNLAMRRRLLR